jgi:cation-transporting ATPase E
VYRARVDDPEDAPAALADSGPRVRTGLSDLAASERRARGEGNDVRMASSRSYARIVRENVFTVVNVVLFVVSMLLVPFGLVADALVTAGPVVANVAVGVVQEVRAKRKLDRLAFLARPTAAIVRDGRERMVDASAIVRGDLLVVRRGDQVLVDARIQEGAVEVDESQLTGESDAVRREAGDMLLSGSVVGSGTAWCEVERVGATNFANQLVAQARQFRDDRTPLQRDVGTAIFAISIMVLLGSLPVAWVLGRPGPQRDPSGLLQAAAVLVALVPQGLAVMITVTYALGAIRISRRGSVVQRLAAVEAMSRVDTLCVDKTGTLTTQRISLEAVRPVGTHDAGLRAVLGALAASTSAGNRTTEAIAAAVPGAPRPVGDEVPFLSNRRWSGLRLGGDLAGTYVMGAPGLFASSSGETGTGGLPADAVAQVDEWTSAGRRVVVVGRAPDGAPLHGPDGQAVFPPGCMPLGIIAFSEELRPGVRNTLESFAMADIDIKVVSGDDPDTVGALARHAGLRGAERTASGLDLGRGSDDVLAEAVAEANVMGRVDPPLKARIIRALRSRGRFVAMIGDGVNDILALRQAHLGIAMGSGSQATRAVADIILIDDDFSVLPDAVIEGQRIVAAMQATLYLLLARTLYMLILVVGAVVLGLGFPISPRNNAVLALVTVGIPTLVIAFWVRPARPPARLLGATARFVIPAAIAAAAVCLPVTAVYAAAGVREDVVATAVTTMTVLCGIGLITLLPTVLAARGGAPSAPGIRDWRPWALAAAMVVLYAVIALVPFARTLFELAPLPAAEIAVLVAIAAAWTAALHLALRVGAVNRFVRPAAAHPSSDSIQAG